MNFKELRQEIKQQIPMIYVYYVWSLFAIAIILYVYLVYLMALYYLSTPNTTPYSILPFLYYNMWLTAAVEIVGFAFIGGLAFVIFRLLQLLRFHKEKLIAVISSADMPNVSDSVNEIKSLEMPRSLLPSIAIVFFFFVPFLEIVSFIIAFYYIYRSHRTIKSLEKLEERAFSALGIKLERRKTQDHNYALYFIVMILSAGLFMLYLIYEAVKEFNAHVSEDYRLLESVEL